jgi:hypothetical protein
MLSTQAITDPMLLDLPIGIEREANLTPWDRSMFPETTIGGLKPKDRSTISVSAEIECRKPSTTPMDTSKRPVPL